MLLTTVYLVRHGQTDWNSSGRLTGQANIGLNHTGKEQVRRTASALREKQANHLYSSTLRRARETAAVIAAATGLEPVVDARLCEIDAGQWTGRVKANLARKKQDAWNRWRSGEAINDSGPVETYTELQHRALSVMDEIVTAHRGERIIVVTHAGVIRVLLSAILGRSFREIEQNDEILPSSTSIIEHYPDGSYRVRIKGDRSYLVSETGHSKKGLLNSKQNSG